MLIEDTGLPMRVKASLLRFGDFKGINEVAFKLKASFIKSQ